ncbi:hypothetical protein, partial [Oceanospirillum multiglobuliferum]
MAAPVPRDFLLSPGQHVGVSGESDQAVVIINQRFGEVLFKRVGDADVSVGSSDKPDVTFSAVAYAALVDTHTSTSTL